MRPPARGGAPTARPKAYPAPLRGWVDSDNPMAVHPLGAAVLENFLPGKQGIRLRGGCQAVSAVDGAGVSIFAYDNGVVRKLFASTASAIHDVTQRDGTQGPAVVTGQEAGDWATVQFAATGKTYLYAVNGHDAPRLFDGGTWQAVGTASTPIAITGAVGPFSHVWSFKSRLFFVRNNSMEVVFLPTGQVGGAAQEINLAGVFKLGGRVLFGTTWSSDSGAGFGDRCVIVSDAGEVAVFEGDDPADPARWQMVSRYEMPPPLGRDAHVRAGGDVLIATTAGLIPLSAAGRDGMAMASAAVSAPISNAWRMAVETSRQDWSVMRWDGAGVIVVTRPFEPMVTWAVNAETGAWFRITGWDMRRAAMHRERFHFIGAGGVVRQGDTTGQDDGAPFAGRYRGLLDSAPTGLKVVRLHRATFRAATGARYALRFVASDRGEFGPSPDPWPVQAISGRWNVGLWDQTTWDSAVIDVVTIDGSWRASGASGQKIAPELQVVSDDVLPALCEFIGCEAMIEVGGLVV